MSYTYEKISSNKVKLSFVIPADEFDAAVTAAYKKERGRINVPGFRKGKAPQSVIENLYGKEVFYEDAFETVMNKAYSEAIAQEKIDIVDRPETDIQQMAAGQDLLCTLEVFVRPDVTLGEYKNLTVEIDHQVVTDADVDAKLESERQKQSREVEVLDRPVEEGDTVNLDYSGSVDGVKFDGGTAEGQTLKIGSHQFIPGFEEQMVGMCNGEEKDITVTFPAEYHAENLAGKEAVFHVKVNSFTKTELPELNDEFVADVSDFTTLADYRADVEKKLQEQAERNNKVAAENAVVEKAVANAEVDIPEAMITDETNYILRDMEVRMSYQGLRMEDYLKYTGQTREQLAESYRDEAENRVKMQLVIEAIRKAEGIEPTDEAVEEQIKEQAERAGQELEAFKKGLTDEQKGYLKDNAAVQMVVDMMMETATVNDKPAEEKTEADAE